MSIKSILPDNTYCIEPLTSQLRDLFLSYPAVELVILFGSLVIGDGKFNSDLDIAVQFNQSLNPDEKMALIERLAKVTGRPVDLIDLRTVGEPLLGQIIINGRRIMGSDDCFARLLIKHLCQEADFMPYLRRILQERRRAWIGR